MKKLKEWISDIDWKYYGFCALILLGLLVVGIIHYYLFTKPVEDRVNAEWQEKYDDMVCRYEDQIDDLRREYENENDRSWRVSYDEGYREGYDAGYEVGLEEGFDKGYEDGLYDGANQ